jgi:hypothetical protein
MLWLIVSPIVVVSSLLCASLCVVARDSDKQLEDLNKTAKLLKP